MPNSDHGIIVQAVIKVPVLIIGISNHMGKNDILMADVIRYFVVMAILSTSFENVDTVRISAFRTFGKNQTVEINYSDGPRKIRNEVVMKT